MATVVLGLAGQALGGVFGAAGAIIGQAAGAIAGSLIDRAIVNALTPPQQVTGPRLTTSDIQTSTEGAPVNRLYGRARLTGTIIWATRFEEVITFEESGGKGFSTPEVETTTYSYRGNFAVGLCEGVIAGIGRVWADGKEIDRTLVEHRVYRGTEGQNPDPLIEAKESEAPAYRGLAYIVFEQLPLGDYGNRLPQISVEVFRPVGALEGQVEGVALIPGNEFGLDTTVVRQIDAAEENRHTLTAATDLDASLDRLKMLCPAIKSVLLVVSWFGDDLRAGNCTIRPKVENATKATDPVTWAVSGLTRSTALVITQIAGRPAFGGTPNDASVIRAIQEINGRGLDVCYLPFIMMDVPPGNTLPDPYSNNAATNGQPVFPWRGRITVSPAAGFTGTVDKTATAATQIAAFTGTAEAADFGGSGTTVTYSGPDEWSYSRFILHNAKLCALAGGVESFLIGSEMIGLTQARSSASAYPFVTDLIALAGEARTILGGGVDIGYAADWSEWNNHRPDDGSDDVRFNLDPLWSDSEIDFIGIDNYLPLSDWRDGSEHTDFDPAGPATVYDAAYLASNVRGGEHFDWFYADQSDRNQQDRTPIVDTAEGKHWVFRQKDLRGWWENLHYNRPGGVESGSETDWTPQSKPIRFIEMGCPAVDKGANQPNLFPDALSSEGGFPHYSSRARDDVMQRAWLEAMIGFYTPTGNNPVSTEYSGRMVDLDHSHVWAWDTRPWPSFPLDPAWADWRNWHTGHWVSGRLGTAPASETIEAILDDAGFSLFDIEPIPAVVDAVTSGNLLSARSLLDALRPAYQFDAVESDGVIKFLARQGRAPAATITVDELVPAGPGSPRYRRTRAQETELPVAVKLRYGDQGRDDQPAAAEARRSAGGSDAIAEHSPPCVMWETRAREIAEMELHAAWVARERLAFALPPSRLALDAGDVVAFQPTGRPVRIDAVGEAAARAVEAFEIDPIAGGTVDLAPQPGRFVPVVPIIPAEAIVVDGPLLQDDDDDHAAYVTGIMSPFRSGIALWRSPELSGFERDRLLFAPGITGVTTADFFSGPVWRWDRVNSLFLDVTRGTLSSASELAVYNGANALLVENADGEWELLQFATATPNGAKSYILTGLLRGQKGTEHAMRDPVEPGARVAIVNPAMRQTGISPELVGLPLNWRVGPSDRDVADPSFSAFELTLNAIARRPLSPARITGTRSSGDWTIAWIRRTRIGGDSWAASEVPLGEESEAYRLEILDGEGGDVLRTFDTTVATQLYTAAQQTTDFGGVQNEFWARVAQKSVTFGLGIWREELVFR
jgi:hypothetical protein